MLQQKVSQVKIAQLCNDKQMKRSACTVVACRTFNRFGRVDPAMRWSTRSDLWQITYFNIALSAIRRKL